MLHFVPHVCMIVRHAQSTHDVIMYFPFNNYNNNNNFRWDLRDQVQYKKLLGHESLEVAVRYD